MNNVDIEEMIRALDNTDDGPFIFVMAPQMFELAKECGAAHLGADGNWWVGKSKVIIGQTL